MNPKKEISLSVPWWSIIRGSFVAGAQFTFLGSFGIVGLTITHGWEAAGIYLLYVPAIIAFFGGLILLCISVHICTLSFQWARRLVCLCAFILATILLGPVVLMPHFIMGIMLTVGVFQDRPFDPAMLICCGLLLIPTIYWSRGLYRFNKESKSVSRIWGFASKYIQNNKLAKKRLKKLIDELSTPPPLIPERIKNIFRRS